MNGRGYAACSSCGDDGRAGDMFCARCGSMRDPEASQTVVLPFGDVGVTTRPITSDVAVTQRGPVPGPAPYLPVASRVAVPTRPLGPAPGPVPWWRRPARVALAAGAALVVLAAAGVVSFVVFRDHSVTCWDYSMAGSDAACPEGPQPTRQGLEWVFPKILRPNRSVCTTRYDEQAGSPRPSDVLEGVRQQVDCTNGGITFHYQLSSSPELGERTYDDLTAATPVDDGFKRQWVGSADLAAEMYADAPRPWGVLETVPAGMSTADIAHLLDVTRIQFPQYLRSFPNSQRADLQN